MVLGNLVKMCEPFAAINRLFGLFLESLNVRINIHSVAPSHDAEALRAGQNILHWCQLFHLGEHHGNVVIEATLDKIWLIGHDCLIIAFRHILGSLQSCGAWQRPEPIG